MNVVILSYGPSRATLAAVKRARRISDVDPIRVVAASETGIRRLDLPGVELIGELGTKGLLMALDEVEGPVLLVHDDVLVTREAAAAMLEELGRRGGLVVAHSNDVGTDHFAGTLPPLRRAAERVREESHRVATRSVHRFRPAAVVAEKGDMVALASVAVVDPRVSVADPDLRVTAAGVVVAHDGTCATRLLPPEGPDGRPLLVASMIVRDEEATLGGCLDSVAGLVDRIEICDTGSEDETVRIAEAHGANVGRIPWRDDFGWARTQALERCRDAHYVLILDADERVECDDPVLLRRYLATYRHEYEAFACEVRNHAVSDGREVSSVIRSVRIFRAEGTKYHGALHEIPVDADTLEPLSGGNLDLLAVAHFGYQQEFIQARDKKARNLAIARSQYEETANAKTAIEYARSLRLAGGEPAEVLAVLDDLGDDFEYADRAVVAFVKGMQALSHLDLGQDEQALRLAREALDLVPADDSAAAVVAEAARRLDRPDALMEAAWHRRRSESVRPQYVVEANEHLFSNRLIWALVETGDLDAAYAEARWLLGRAPEAFTEWEVLVDALLAHPDGIRPLFVLILGDSTGRWVRPSLARLGGEQTAELCHAYLAEGGSAAEAVTAGMLAAAAAGRQDLVDDLAAHLHLLDGVERAELISRLEAKGMAVPVGAD